MEIFLEDPNKIISEIEEIMSETDWRDEIMNEMKKIESDFHNENTFFEKHSENVVN